MKPIQCRMARAALGWSTLDLAKHAEVGGNTVNRFEAGQDARLSSVDKMEVALEAAGVEFIPENGGGPGVRLKKRAGGDAGPKPVGPATDAVDAMDAAISKDRTRTDNARLASVKKTGEEVPQEEWERFEAADKKPKRKGVARVIRSEGRGA